MPRRLWCIMGKLIYLFPVWLFIWELSSTKRVMCRISNRFCLLICQLQRHLLRSHEILGNELLLFIIWYFSVFYAYSAAVELLWALFLTNLSLLHLYFYYIYIYIYIHTHTHTYCLKVIAQHLRSFVYLRVSLYSSSKSLLSTPTQL